MHRTELNQDEVASWHLLQLSEQGRPVEVAAQFIASWLLCSDGIGNAMIDEIFAIATRTHELVESESSIWPGLMPGGGESYEAHVWLNRAIEREEEHHKLAREKHDPFKYELVIWKDKKCLTSAIGSFEGDLNAARVILDYLKAVPGSPTHATLYHFESGERFLYTKDMCRLIVAIEEVQEITGRIPSFDRDFDCDQSFQMIHELAFDRAQEFFKDEQ